MQPTRWHQCATIATHLVRIASRFSDASGVARVHRLGSAGRKFTKIIHKWNSAKQVQVQRPCVGVVVVVRCRRLVLSNVSVLFLFLLLARLSVCVSRVFGQWKSCQLAHSLLLTLIQLCRMCGCCLFAQF